MAPSTFTVEWWSSALVGAPPHRGRDATVSVIIDGHEATIELRPGHPPSVRTAPRFPAALVLDGFESWLSPGSTTDPRPTAAVLLADGPITRVAAPPFDIVDRARLADVADFRDADLDVELRFDRCPWWGEPCVEHWRSGRLVERPSPDDTVATVNVRVRYDRLLELRAGVIGLAELLDDGIEVTGGVAEMQLLGGLWCGPESLRASAAATSGVGPAAGAFASWLTEPGVRAHLGAFEAG